MMSKIIDVDCLGIHFPWSYHTFGTKKPNILFMGIFKKIKTWQKIVAYKVYHRMITPNSNIIISKLVWKIDPMSHNFETKKSRINVKEWLKPLTGRYKMVLFWYVSLKNDNFCFEIPFKLRNQAPFLDNKMQKFKFLTLKPCSSLKNS